MKESDGFVRDCKPDLTKRHFDEIRKGDAIVVVNEEKNGVPNYVGGATFSEIMLAFYFGKKIFFLNPIPEHEKVAPFREEMETVNPVILNGDLDMVR